MFSQLNAMHQLKKYINPLFLILLIVINPLIFSSKTVDITYAPQFYFFGISCLIFIVLSWIFNNLKPWSIPINTISITVVLYFLLSLISLVFANNKQESLIEIYKIGSWVLLIFMLYQIIQEEQQQFVILKSMSVIGFVLSFIGFMQLTKMAFTNIPGNVIPYGTLGNRNIFVPSILIILPFIIYLFFYCKDNKWKIFSSFSIVLILTVVVWSLMRTALLAVIIALIFNLILAMAMHKKVQFIMQKYRFVKIIIPVFLLLLLLGGGYLYFQKLKIINNKKSSLLSFNSTNERSILWQHSLAMLKDYPMTGVGAGNWKIMFPNYGLGDLPPEARKAEMFYIRPENDFLWVFAETGIIGGLCYVVIFAGVALTCLQKIRKSQDKKEKIFALAVLNALILYAVTAFFGFPKDRTYLHNEFAMIISLALVIYTHISTPYRLIKFPKLLCLIAFSLFTFKGVQIYAGEKKLSKLIEARKINQHQQVLDYSSGIIKNGYLIDQTSTPIYFYEGVAYFSLQQIDNAITSFHEAEALHPYHLHVLNNLATCYAIKGNPNKSMLYLNEALRISPDFQEAIINLAGLHYNNRNYKEAYKYFFLARTDNKQNQLYNTLDAIITKTVNDSLLKLTAQYIELGELEKAEQSLKRCLHQNKLPQYHDMQVAIVRKRQQLNLLKK
jgi:O-antigen ligase/Tfp pilus assembly protein PilF